MCEWSVLLLGGLFVYNKVLRLLCVIIEGDIFINCCNNFIFVGLSLISWFVWCICKVDLFIVRLDIVNILLVLLWFCL